ncbi:hypothetical protein JTE90_018157 [Oedothorax gibbosus]|uniref:C2H2-type domain-containing protein n=1 Tax=Oedothorax gibbosus TaxID=931172 RepID=A0AAV6U7I6_9ARAC|nr:hypothetical protein JTE90_018157 [Oedothorax gibbosus]
MSKPVSSERTLLQHLWPKTKSSALFRAQVLQLTRACPPRYHRMPLPHPKTAQKPFHLPGMLICALPRSTRNSYSSHHGPMPLLRPPRAAGGNTNRQRKRDPPPLGDKENDPPSIPNLPARIGNTLHLSFPIHPSLKCPEEDCPCALFHAANWTASKQSLNRHISTNHGIIIRNTEKWCRLCQRRTPSRVSEHICFKSQPHVTTLESNLLYKCKTCIFSCSTKRGLTNHLAAHKRNLATPNISLPQKSTNRTRKPRELLTAAQKRAKQDPAWSALHVPQDTNSVTTSNRFQPLEDLPDNDPSTPRTQDLSPTSGGLPTGTRPATNLLHRRTTPPRDPLHRHPPRLTPPTIYPLTMLVTRTSWILPLSRPHPLQMMLMTSHWWTSLTF